MSSKAGFRVWQRCPIRRGARAEKTPAPPGRQTRKRAAGHPALYEAKRYSAQPTAAPASATSHQMATALPSSMRNVRLIDAEQIGLRRCCDCHPIRSGLRKRLVLGLHVRI